MKLHAHVDQIGAYEKNILQPRSQGPLQQAIAASGPLNVNMLVHDALASLYRDHDELVDCLGGMIQFFLTCPHSRLLSQVLRLHYSCLLGVSTHKHMLLAKRRYQETCNTWISSAQV